MSWQLLFLQAATQSGFQRRAPTTGISSGRGSASRRNSTNRSRRRGTIVIRGLDVSIVQGVLDWSRVDAAVRFVLPRCGVGNDGKDSAFDENVRRILASGRIVGPYHFLYPLPVVPGHESRDAVAQARAHFAAAKGLGTHSGELPPFLDLEWPAPQDWAKWGVTATFIKECAVTYLTEMDRLTGRVCGIYLYPDYGTHLGDLSMFALRPFYEASYTVVPARMTLGTPAVWQDTGGGGRLYNGVPVDTDLVSEDALAGLTLL